GRVRGEDRVHGGGGPRGLERAGREDVARGRRRREDVPDAVRRGASTGGGGVGGRRRVQQVGDRRQDREGPVRDHLGASAHVVRGRRESRRAGSAARLDGLAR